MAASDNGTRCSDPADKSTLAAVLKRLRRSAVTVHGFRSTFRDWCAELATGFPSEVAELALAHKVGTAVEAAYRRSDLFDRRRALAEAWARYCNGGAEVIDFPVACRSPRSSRADPRCRQSISPTKSVPP